ncbi:MAG: preprotein translocase subunit SecG [Spirochaetaceae bacterium]|nr:MAG: preprotein translocase subunit SecG [Spirochaetaceae bacterium]
MGLLSILLLVLFVITALLLIGIVMIQDEGGEGLGGIFGGGASAQVGNRSGNILTKTTSILGAVFLLSSFGLAWMGRTADASDVEAAARRLQDGDAVEWWRTDDAPQPEMELPELDGGRLVDPAPDNGQSGSED